MVVDIGWFCFCIVNLEIVDRMYVVFVILMKVLVICYGGVECIIYWLVRVLMEWGYMVILLVVFGLSLIFVNVVSFDLVVFIMD